MYLDAIFPLWKADKKFFVHHAGNVGLTAEYLNAAKGTDIPIILALALDAIKTTDAGTNTSKCQQLELGFDHCFLIRVAIPNVLSVTLSYTNLVFCFSLLRVKTFALHATSFSLVLSRRASVMIILTLW